MKHRRRRPNQNGTERSGTKRNGNPALDKMRAPGFSQPSGRVGAHQLLIYDPSDGRTYSL
eukprot:522557-Prymnesium_polylepis.1